MGDLASHGDKGDKIEVLRLLLDAGAKTEIREVSGGTALSFACGKNHEASIKLLLDYWADPNIATNAGAMPLTIAARHGSVGVMRLLIERQADINAVDPSCEGMTALHIACTMEYVECVEVLLHSGGCDTTMRDQNGKQAAWKQLLGRRKA